MHELSKWLYHLIIRMSLKRLVIYKIIMEEALCVKYRDILDGGSFHVAVNWLRMAGDLSLMMQLSTELINLEWTYLGNNHIG